MITFKIKAHSRLPGTMVEVWRDGKFVASIYGHDGGVRLVSKYLDSVHEETGKPPSLVVKLTA